MKLLRTIALSVALLLGLSVQGGAVVTNKIPNLVLENDANGNGMNFVNLNNVGLRTINGIVLSNFVAGVATVNGLAGNVVFAYQVVLTNNTTVDTFLTNGQILGVTHYVNTNTPGFPLDTNYFTTNGGTISLNTNAVALQNWASALVLSCSNAVLAVASNSFTANNSGVTTNLTSYGALNAQGPISAAGGVSSGAITNSGLTSGKLVGTGTGGKETDVSIGSGLSLVGNTLSVTNGGGGGASTFDSGTFGYNAGNGSNAVPLSNNVVGTATNYANQVGLNGSNNVTAAIATAGAAATNLGRYLPNTPNPFRETQLRNKLSTVSNVCVVGDSIAYGVGNPGTNLNWPYLWASNMNVALANLAVSGTYVGDFWSADFALATTNQGLVGFALGNNNCYGDAALAFTNSFFQEYLGHLLLIELGTNKIAGTNASMVTSGTWNNASNGGVSPGISSTGIWTSGNGSWVSNQVDGQNVAILMMGFQGNEAKFNVTIDGVTSGPYDPLYDNRTVNTYNGFVFTNLGTGWHGVRITCAAGQGSNICQVECIAGIDIAVPQAPVILCPNVISGSNGVNPNAQIVAYNSQLFLACQLLDYVNLPVVEVNFDAAITGIGNTNYNDTRHPNIWGHVVLAKAATQAINGNLIGYPPFYPSPLGSGFALDLRREYPLSAAPTGFALENDDGNAATFLNGQSFVWVGTGGVRYWDWSGSDHSLNTFGGAWGINLGHGIYQGDGQSITNLPASQLASGTVPDAVSPSTYASGGNASNAVYKVITNNVSPTNIGKLSATIATNGSILTNSVLISDTVSNGFVPIASLVKPGTTMTAVTNADNTLTLTPATMTSGTLGIGRPDGTTITVAGGVLTANAGGTSGIALVLGQGSNTVLYNPTLTNVTRVGFATNGGMGTSGGVTNEGTNVFDSAYVQTNLNLGASAIVATDANKKQISLAIGSGLSSDGTTLTATGGGSGIATSVGSGTNTTLYNLTRAGFITNGQVGSSGGVTNEGTNVFDTTYVQTNLNLGASAIVATDANKKQISLAIGSGLSSDGTTLTATGGGSFNGTNGALMPTNQAAGVGLGDYDAGWDPYTYGQSWKVEHEYVGGGSSTSLGSIGELLMSGGTGLTGTVFAINATNGYPRMLMFSNNAQSANYIGTATANTVYSEIQDTNSMTVHFNVGVAYGTASNSFWACMCSANNGLGGSTMANTLTPTGVFGFRMFNGQNGAGPGDTNLVCYANDGVHTVSSNFVSIAPALFASPTNLVSLTLVKVATNITYYINGIKITNLLYNPAGPTLTGWQVSYKNNDTTLSNSCMLFLSEDARYAIGR